MSNDCLQYFCDGSFLKLRNLFRSDLCTLQIVGYYDDIEVVNLWGRMLKNIKLGCIFFFHENIRLQISSTLKYIHLLAVG